MRRALLVAAGSIALAAPGAGAARLSGRTAAVTRSALSSFVAAFGRGDLQRLNSLFARASSFQWYSSNVPGLRRTDAARDRGSPIASFRARHLARDRMRLVAFRFTGNSHGYGNVTFELRRAGADYRHGAWFGAIGKGAALCSGRASPAPVQLVVVSIGAPGSAR